MSEFIKETLTAVFCIALFVFWIVRHVTYDLDKWNKRWK